MTLTGLVLSFAIYMGIGWILGGRTGLEVGAALNLVRYGVALWHAAYLDAPAPRDNEGGAA